MNYPLFSLLESMRSGVFLPWHFFQALQLNEAELEAVVKARALPYIWHPLLPLVMLAAQPTAISISFLAEVNHYSSIIPPQTHSPIHSLTKKRKQQYCL